MIKNAPLFGVFFYEGMVFKFSNMAKSFSDGIVKFNYIPYSEIGKIFVLSDIFKKQNQPPKTSTHCNIFLLPEQVAW
jgi:hypothetical protein